MKTSNCFLFMGLIFLFTFPAFALQLNQLFHAARDLVELECRPDDVSQSKDSEKCDLLRKGLAKFTYKANQEVSGPLIEELNKLEFWRSKDFPAKDIPKDALMELAETWLGGLATLSSLASDRDILQMMGCVELSRFEWKRACESRPEGERDLAFMPNNECKLLAQPLVVGLIDNCSKIIFRFPKNEILGKGGFKTAHSSYLYGSWKNVCVLKFLEPYETIKPSQKVRLDREISILNALTNQKLVGLPEVFHADRKRFVMKMYDHDLWHSRTSFSPSIWIQAGSQLNAGLRVLHEVGLMHNDIKGGNVMLTDSDNPAKIAAVYLDFGMAYSPLARCLEHKDMPKHGTRKYGAPEQFNNWQNKGNCEESAREALKSDVFAHAGVIYFLKHGDLPWVKDSKCGNGSTLESCLPSYIEKLKMGDVWDQLIARGIAVKPQERLTIQEFQKEFDYFARLEIQKIMKPILPLNTETSLSTVSSSLPHSLAVLPFVSVSPSSGRYEIQLAYRSSSPDGPIEIKTLSADPLNKAAVKKELNRFFKDIPHFVQVPQQKIMQLKSNLPVPQLPKPLMAIGHRLAQVETLVEDSLIDQPGLFPKPIPYNEEVEDSYYQIPGFSFASEENIKVELLKLTVPRGRYVIHFSLSAEGDLTPAILYKAKAGGVIVTEPLPVSSIQAIQERLDAMRAAGEITQPLRVFSFTETL